MEEPRNRVPSALLDDLPLDLRHSSAVNFVVSELYKTVGRSFNARRQLIYRIAHGLAEITQLLSIHPSVEGLTDIGAE